MLPAGGVRVRRLIIKEKGKMWPTVVWKGSQLVVYYLDDEDEVTHVEKTRKLDFDELLLRIDTGSSVFITTQPVEEELCPVVRECEK